MSVAGRRMSVTLNAMRALVVILALGLAALPAAAEPAPAKAPASSSPKKAPGKKKSSKPAKAKTASPGVSLGSMAQAAAGKSDEPAATPNGARRLDLTPARLFGQGGNGTPDRRGKEKSSGLSLGEDSSWKVQAVQVGAIAAGFAALVAICGNGNCLLPFGGGADNLGPPADLQIRPDNEPRPAR